MSISKLQLLTGVQKTSATGKRPLKGATLLGAHLLLGPKTLLSRGK
jgi:hypothetical protein